MAPEIGNIVCDSSSLISLSEACCLGIISELGKHIAGKFLIPGTVKAEIIDHPIQIKRFEWSAIRLRRMVEKGELSLVSSDDLRATTQDLLKQANSIYYIEDRPLEILQAGETEALALLQKSGAQDLLIDEKTTRLLLEGPDKLSKHLSDRYQTKVRMDKGALNDFRAELSDVYIIRSSELAILAYEMGEFDVYGAAKKDALEATLYALKYAGCGVSFEELAEYLHKA